MTDASDATTPVPPAITSVACEEGMPTPKFVLSWTPRDGYTGPFDIVVTASGGASVQGTAQAGANAGTWTADAGAMQETGNYYIAVKPSGTTLSSDQVWLRFTAPTEIATQFDGTVIDIEWTPAAGPPSSDVFLLFTAGTYSQGAKITAASGARFLPDLTQVPAGTDWSLTLTPEQDKATGLQSAAAPVFWQRPPVDALSLNPGTGDELSVTLATSPGGLPASPGFVAEIAAQGTELYRSAPLTATTANGKLEVTATVPSPPAPLDIGRINTAALRLAQLVPLAAGGNRTSTGPAGLPITLLPTPPAGLSVETSVPPQETENRTVTLTMAPPPGPVAATGASFVTSLTANTPAFGAGFTRTVTLESPDIGSAITATARGMVGNSLGLQGADIPVLTSLPVLTRLDVADGLLTAEWNAVGDAGVTGYTAAILANGMTVAAYPAGTTTATIPVPGSPFSLQVRAEGNSTRGPFSTPAAAIAEAPSGLKAVFAATGADGTLSWSAVDGGNHYVVEIWAGDQIVETLTTQDYTASIALPGNLLEPGGSYRFTVHAVSTGGTIAKSGPRSIPAPILASAPATPEIAWNGTELTASWPEVTGASGYVVSVLEGGTVTGDPVRTSEPAIRMPLAYDAGKTFTVTVQAANGPTLGPTSPAVAAFTPGLYPATPTDAPPQILPYAAPAMTAEAITLYLPDLFATAPDPANLPTNNSFTMTAGSAPFPYLLTIPADSRAWTFTAEPLRSGVKTDYLDLISALETLTATPSGIATLQQAIGRAMPQTYAETLYYNYGFVPDQGVCDLRPGTILRVEYENYQYVGANAADTAYLNGYVGTAVAEYPVASYLGGGARLSGLDAFLGQIASAGGVDIPTPSASSGGAMQGGGGLVDSFYAQFRRPFLRIVYPTNFLSQSSQGSAYPQSNALLLAGSSFTVLNTATQNIRDTGQTGADVAELYFRGRTTLSAAIDVQLNGAPQRVSIASPVSALLERGAARPPQVDLPFSGVRMTRATGTAVTSDASEFDLSAGHPVQLGWQPGANAAWLDLPLLHGDLVRTELP